MAINNGMYDYNPQTGAYGNNPGNEGTGKSGGSMAAAAATQTTAYMPKADDYTGGGIGSNVDTRLVTPYEDLLAKYQTLKRPGTGYTWTDIAAQQLDPRYTQFRTKMYGTVENLMNQPTGYTDAQRQMIQGQALDKIYAGQAGQAEQLRRQAARNGLLGSGVLMGQQQQQGLQGQQQVASTMRDIALQELEKKTEDAYKAAALGQSWAGQMGDEAYQQQQYLDSIARANQQGRLAADRSKGAGLNQYNAGLMSLWEKIADQQVGQAKYNDQYVLTAAELANERLRDYYNSQRGIVNDNPLYGQDNPHV